MTAVGLTALAGLALTACDGAPTTHNSAAGPAVSARQVPAPSMSGMAMPDMPGAQLFQYDPANKAGATFFASVLSGLNEIPNPNGKPTGDKNGNALAVMRVQGGEVSFAFSWSGIGTPTEGHIHAGAFGTDGDVKIPLFATKLPDGRSSVYGTVKVTDAHLLADIEAHPQNFYFNLHTAQFPGGAVRGQLFGVPTSFNLLGALKDTAVKSVVKGTQIYACTKTPAGSHAFTQDNVNAELQGGIHHTFKASGPAGPPQWVASDGSAVIGKALAKLANGSENVPVVAFRAVQEGASHGLLAHTDMVFRLNTKGGLAPAGTCDPATRPNVSVPYTAEYLFLGGAS